MSCWRSRKKKLLPNKLVKLDLLDHYAFFQLPTVDGSNLTAVIYLSENGVIGCGDVEWVHGGWTSWGRGASETSSDWLMVIGARRKTISYPGSWKPSHHARPASPCDFPLSVDFFLFSPSLIVSLSPSLSASPPTPSLHFSTVENLELTLSSQSCIYLVYPRVCSVIHLPQYCLVYCTCGLNHLTGGLHFDSGDNRGSYILFKGMVVVVECM